MKHFFQLFIGKRTVVNQVVQKNTNLKYYSVLILLGISLLTACRDQKIETAKTLDKSTIDLIKSLGLLDENERILQYYSNFRKDKAGNFFTDRRIAHYWLDSRQDDKSDTTSAFYVDIVSIDTVYNVPDTFAPYMEIETKDSTKFRVYVEGTKAQLKSFFEEAISVWKKNRH